MSTPSPETGPNTDEVRLVKAISAGEADATLEHLGSVLDSPAVAEAKRRRRTVLLLRKIALTILGGVILIAGLAMLFVPGPGVLAIVLGFFVLSLEYEWAERRFDQLRDKAVEAAHAAADNRLGTGLSVVGALAMIVGGLVWALNDGLPFSSWVTGGSVVAGGVLGLASIAWAIRDLRQTRARAVEN